ncbi:glycoside hydrolase family 43 protein [Macroventuria anomochaeta]|uniref:Glycoside hydrolase family 43 protein n=1 Tax=Macroventuria anomochaeta TaxID=301207 RepID=A0ACB6RGN1_9PLEO|nr:glycoside hydrolase family 43 protein [Macroventuria anomochaeta]KAF2621075.1 glycoside hydrolase family 43 protein [Macroventuria anomochaeta]
MSASFTNPVVWEDLPDMEVIRVDSVYYMSASSFHFSPGAPILRSYNLVDWKYVGHSIPTLPPTEQFSLNERRPMAYGKGVWASTMKYRKSNGLFYFYSAIQGTNSTYIWTAASPSDVWTAHSPIQRFYYDLGLLIDDDDTMYIAHGTRTIQVAQLSPDGLAEVISKVVYSSDDYLEGARMYRIQGAYYIWLTKSWDTQVVLKSTGGPFGPYEARVVIAEMRSPLPGAGPPHQGALVDTPDNRWYYMSFTDAFPTGRVPLLAPVVFDTEGWPVVTGEYTDSKGSWLLEYPQLAPGSETSSTQVSRPTRHNFSQDTLDPCWEWNHNPDDSKWELKDGQLILETGSVTQYLHCATNTLTLRTIGPGSICTFLVDVSMLKDGDRAGISMFRDESAYIGVHIDGDKPRIAYVEGIKVGPTDKAIGWFNGRPAALDWECKSAGSVEAETPLASSRLWLRIVADLRAAWVAGYENVTRKATFHYSFDGVTFMPLGPEYALSRSTAGFVGYRFALFNFATKALGGKVKVQHCDMEVWNPSM